MAKLNLRIYLEKLKEAEGEMGPIDRTDLGVEKFSDQLDQIQHGQSREITVHRLNAQREKRLLIAAALEKLRDGSYGKCVECDGQIHEKRLSAVPWAERCVKCQEVHDNQPLKEEEAA